MSSAHHHMKLYFTGFAAVSGSLLGEREGEWTLVCETTRETNWKVLAFGLDPAHKDFLPVFWSWEGYFQDLRPPPVLYARAGLLVGPAGGGLRECREPAPLHHLQPGHRPRPLWEEVCGARGWRAGSHRLLVHTGVYAIIFFVIQNLFHWPWHILSNTDINIVGIHREVLCCDLTTTNKVHKITADIAGAVRRVCHWNAGGGLGSPLLPIDQRPQWAAVLHLGDPVRQPVFPDQTPQPGVSGPDQSESLNLRCFTKKIYMLLMMKFWAVQWCWLWTYGTMMFNEINNSLEKQLTKVVFLVFVVISGDVEVNPRIGLWTEETR